MLVAAEERGARAKGSEGLAAEMRSPWCLLRVESTAKEQARPWPTRGSCCEVS